MKKTFNLQRWLYISEQKLQFALELFLIYKINILQQDKSFGNFIYLYNLKKNHPTLKKLDKKLC